MQNAGIPYSASYWASVSSYRRLPLLAVAAFTSPASAEGGKLTKWLIFKTLFAKCSSIKFLIFRIYSNIANKYPAGIITR